MQYQVNIKGVGLTIQDVEGSVSLPYIVKELDTGSDYALAHSIPFSNGDIILDLGANIGLFSIMMAKLYSQVRIYAFEPLLTNFNHLVANIKTNGVEDKILPFNLAITGDGRPVIIGSPPNCTGGAALHYWNYGTPGLIKNEVPSVTLDSIFNLFRIGRCRLLKIDVEGSEFEILKKTTKLHLIDYLVGEFHYISDLKLDPDELFAYCLKKIIQPNNISVRIWGPKKT